VVVSTAHEELWLSTVRDPSREIPEPFEFGTGGMASTDRQPMPNSPPSSGAVLRLTDGTIFTMVKPGRQAPPLTVIVRQRAEAERKIPPADVGEVMWSSLSSCSG
jgi:hypothetical protein